MGGARLEALLPIQFGWFLFEWQLPGRVHVADKIESEDEESTL